MSHNSTAWPFPTGYKVLDQAQGGVKAGELAVITASKGTAKLAVMGPEDYDKLLSADRPETVELYRHMRYKNSEGEIQGRGGITFFFHIDFEADQLSFSVALCRNDENFNKVHGNKIAYNRFVNGCMFQGDYDRDLSLIDNAYTILYNYFLQDEEAPGYTVSEIGLIGASINAIRFINGEDDQSNSLIIDLNEIPEARHAEFIDRLNTLIDEFA